MAHVVCAQWLGGHWGAAFLINVVHIPLVARFGVGGEYPMAAGSAAERAEAGGKQMAKHRGREVLLAPGPQALQH